MLEDEARQLGPEENSRCRFRVVIPARYASTRLPGKPLADIGGKPMVVRVVEARCKERCRGDLCRDR